MDSSLATSRAHKILKDSSLFKEACYINGRWVSGSGDRLISVDDPATGEVIGTVPRFGAAETANAIAAAAAALHAWRAKTAKERAVLLRRWFDLMMANQDDLAALLTLEQGKPLAESRTEVAYGASFIEWFAEEGKRTYGDTIPSHAADKRIVVIKQPIGVVGCITPWNFPIAMITRKVGPALAAGCTVVVKPASQTPYSALALAVLAERAGIHGGVLNVITGSATEIGGELTSNPTVRKISFTGSTEIGKVLMAQCAGTVKKMSLELGGNAPFIVFDDADLDAAAEGALISKYRNTGQTCVCANRILVQASVFDAFTGRFAKAVDTLKVGPGLTDGVSQGPLIDKAAVEKVESHVRDAVAKGAKILRGGQRLAGSDGSTANSQFFAPTILTGATPEMALAREETFGPVAPIFRFETEADAIALANATEYGLAAYFYGRDIGRVWRVAEALEYGIIGINTGLISTEVAPFGGVKESGMGREGSKYGIEDYLEIKYLCHGGIKS
ncbi:MAG TPA: NAD-dependent succinate-semialdehyde dehydrogenase [Vicinamibacterales bacterium]|jgi:succinate-semialdehyde dehydrogenase/glutarate-semialdehyde dehydrogenase|nr:NAD-dependent succinate-semialdehyde dehydrogenase [Vicinamibacterales bacterium]